MVKFADIKQDYEAMWRNFSLLDSTVKLSRGMRTRHSSGHDIDAVITMLSRKASSLIEAICWKWNDLFVEKYGLTLDAVIQLKIEGYVMHIYDFDYRCGLADSGYQVLMNENGEKCLDGK
jgi:hypothetical protein